MGLLDPIMSTASGIAVFAVVMVVLVRVLSAVLPNAVSVAFPAALGLGMAAMTGTYMGLAGRPGSLEFRIAFGSGSFGVTFLGVFVVGFLTSGRLDFGVLAGAGTGVLAGLGVLAVTRS